MSASTILFGILGALLVGAVSPGPSFVLVARISVTASRLDGLAAALGMGFAGAIFGSLALAGLSAVLMQVEWLYFSLRMIGGAYLVYLAVRIWRGASEPVVIPMSEILRTRSLCRSFRAALLVQLSNPKTAIVYGSIFAAFLPDKPAFWLLVALPPLIFIVETSWYAAVALVLSASGPRSIYLGSKRWIDRTASVIMGALGVTLIVECIARRDL